MDLQASDKEDGEGGGIRNARSYAEGVGAVLRLCQRERPGWSPRANRYAGVARNAFPCVGVGPIKRRLEGYGLRASRNRELVEAARKGGSEYFVNSSHNIECI